MPFAALSVNVSLELLDLKLQVFIIASQALVDFILLIFDQKSLANDRVTSLDVVR
jgi:hypothetical protein